MTRSRTFARLAAATLIVWTVSIVALHQALSFA
jgi:hypothetical protein